MVREEWKGTGGAIYAVEIFGELSIECPDDPKQAVDRWHSWDALPGDGVLRKHGWR